MSNKKQTKSGVVSILGRSNVGKSTLLNLLVSQRISITSRKPQTTRHQLLGIKTEGNSQVVYVDTPGFHLGQKRVLNKYMNKLAINSIFGVDLILFIVEAQKWKEEDQYLLNKIPPDSSSVLLVINKIDLISEKLLLIKFIKEISQKFNFLEVFPISALKKKSIESLEKNIFSRIPYGEHSYPKEQVVDSSKRFLSSEVIREKCITRIGDEIPYRLTVIIDLFERHPKITNINATLFVEKNSQKGIVIGKNGKRLKAIGTAARKDLENMLKSKVMLRLWVKVKKDWTDNKVSMNTMGYEVA